MYSQAQLEDDQIQIQRKKLTIRSMEKKSKCGMFEFKAAPNKKNIGKNLRCPGSAADTVLGFYCMREEAE